MLFGDQPIEFGDSSAQFLVLPRQGFALAFKLSLFEHQLGK